MENIYLTLYILACLLHLPGCLTHKEEECIEVGFARSSYLTVDQGYGAAKEALVTLWQNEDKVGDPSYRDFSPQTKNVTRAAILLEETSKNVIGLIRKTRVGKRCREEWLLKGIEKHVTPLIQLDKDFAEELGLVMSFRCLVGSPFPNVDGTCINEEGPDMGAIGAKFLRLLTPTPGQGGFKLRGSVDTEKSLPSAREVGRVIRSHLQKPSVTALLTEFSHFLALDSFSIPESARVENINCCENPDYIDCAPIFLEEDDPMYSTIKCLNFKRSVPAQAILGNRESLSVISTYLDATPIYGATNEIAFKLKEGYFGYLKYPASIDDVENLDANKKKNKCEFPKSFKGCFNLDPKESNYIENLRLLLILEHNYLAEALAEINPHFDDALLYNEARRILIAQYNAIIYGELVPLLVGEEMAKKHNLLPGSEGPAVKFIPEVNPGILTSFALAAYRNPAMIDEWKKEWGQTDILSSHHYHSIRDDSYQDLLAMDIQRGRDHGLPNYGAWRSFCDSGNQISSWEDVEKIFDKEVMENLRKIYQEEVNDIDVLVSLLEKPEEGAVVGKVFACILVDQFARLRTGNRLYWEHETSMLTVEQKEAIRTQASSAALLCRHLGIEKVPQNAFKVVDENNPEVECSSFSKFNLTAWTDTSLIEVMKKKKEEEEMAKVGDTQKGNEDEASETQEKAEEKKSEVKLDEREREKEQIRQSLIKEEMRKAEERRKEEERIEIEEKTKREDEEMKEREKYNDEMQRAEERIREEMRIKEEKRGKQKTDNKTPKKKKSKDKVEL